MKIILSNKSKKIVFVISLILMIIFFIAINLLDTNYIKVASEINKYEIRSELLMSAMYNVGVCKTEDAAKIWSEGLKMRSAAMQYSVMTKELEEKYI